MLSLLLRIKKINKDGSHEASRANPLFHHSTTNAPTNAPPSATTAPTKVPSAKPTFRPDAEFFEVAAALDVVEDPGVVAEGWAPVPVVVVPATDLLLLAVDEPAAEDLAALEVLTDAHSACSSATAVAWSAAVQFALRHARAADWNAALVQTHVRSVKLEQPPLAAAVVTQLMMQGESEGLTGAAELVVVDWAFTTAAKAEIARTSLVLKSMSA